MSGDGYTSPVVGGEGALIRDHIRSRNFPPDGWQIDADGNAEFNDVTLRGELTTGDAPEPRIEIRENEFGFPEIELYSGDATETSAARIANASKPETGNVSRLQLETSNDGGGIDVAGKVFLLAAAPQPGLSGYWLFLNPGAFAMPVAVDAASYLVLQRTTPASLETNSNALIIGSQQGLNLGGDPQGFQARDDHAAATLRLNPAGGDVTIEGVSVPTPPRCHAFQSVAQSIPNNTSTAVLLGGEQVDNNGIHSTSVNPSRMTIVTPGRYRCIGQAAFAANATGYRIVYLSRNGGAVAQSRGNAISIVSLQQAYAEILCSAGDYIEMDVQHTAGAALNLIVGATITFLHVVWCSAD